MDKGENCKAFPLPVTGNRIEVGILQELIYEEGFHDVGFWERASGGEAEWATAYVEIQQIRSGNRGNLLIGENYGRILAVLEMMDITIRLVRSGDWKKALFPGQKTQGNKDISIQYCLQAGYELPTLRPKGKKLHDGVADSICIALYGLDDAGIKEVSI
jgi:hypothetical protein